ncbi:MAG: hypothetical protein RLZZ459_1185, partial [Cyanobacteriota bacterium]
EAVLVRRLKDDLRIALNEAFPERIVEPLRIPRGSLPPDTPELELSRLLQRYRKQREARLLAEEASKRAINADRLVITNLQKRLLSSVEAFARTLAVHQRSLAARQQSERLSRMELLEGGISADSELAELSDDEVLDLEDAQTRSALRQTLEADQSDQQLLEAMAKIANSHRHRPDPRIEKLADWVQQHLCPGLGSADLQWQPTRLLIFTDYVDTKRYLEQQLQELLGEEEADRRVASFSGGMSEDNRERLKARFNADPDQEPLRILIATDAAREGVNLQNHCRHLIHFDIPWNPSKLEQRNGRIDRKLQQAPQVWCHYFLLEDRPEDRVMEVLIEKTEVIRKELGSLSPLVQQQVEEALEGGIDLEQLDLVQQRLEGMDSAASDRGALLQRSREELEATRHRQLEQQQDTLRHLLAKSEQWLAFAHDPFRQALNVSLELLGVNGLEPYTDERGQPCWRLANPEELVSQTRDSSWDTTLDSLRGVKPAKAFASDWRRNNPVRPVIFSDPGRLSAEAVHLHLEHRLVQRLLSRFLAQGFLHHELKRACVVPCRDPQPRLIVLGRLSLFGEGAARLHDELIAVMADWHPGADRQQALQPVGGDQRQLIWTLLQEALKEAAGGTLPALDTSHLQSGADADVSALLPQLHQEAERAREAATELLQERGRLEAEALKTVLRNQRQRIRDTLRQRSQEISRLDRKAAKAEATPLITGLADVVKIPELDPASMSERERRQLASDQKHWQRRLETIDTELASEPKRIEASYRVVTHRLEPAGLVYLWPISG